MRTSIHFLLSASMLMFAAQRSSPQQPAAPVFQAESNLVVVRTQVFDRETRQPIVGLTRSDFQVFDESSLAELTVFDDSPAPLNMLLLTDVSGGFTNQHIGSCIGALYHSLTPQDQTAVMSFSDNPPKIRTHFTSDKTVVSQGLRIVFMKDRNNGMRRLKTSRIFDAIDAAAQYFLKTPRVRRPAIVVVTHNREAKSKTTKGRALENLLESSATLEAVVVPQETGSSGYSMGIGIFGRTKAPPRTEAPTQYLEDLGSIEPFARETGGQTLRVDLGPVPRTASDSGIGGDWAAMTIGPLVKDLMARLRSQYTLGIQGMSSEKREFRRLSVQLTEEARQRYPKAAVHARSGYWTAVKQGGAGPVR
jgi:VWFA-related protein